MKGEKDGLTAGQAAARRREYGPNIILEQLPPVWYIQLFRAFISPFNAVLVAVAMASLTVDVLLSEPGERDFKTVVILVTMILLSSLLRFWQEYRSNRAAEKLKKIVRATATVLRRPDGEKEVHLESLVPGDIILLSAGDMTPADCRILESKDLFVIQSALTGEAMPVEKIAEPVTDTEKKAVIELENICLMGANIQSGSARAIVVHTGDRTFLGSLSQAITAQEAETSFDKGVGEVSRLLMRFVLVMAPLVFLINGLTKGDWLEAFLFAITVAVGLTPEMLPMIVTTNLAKGAYNMSKEKVIVRKLNAIQNIGAMDVLCTDKTGTLTMDKIVLEKHLNVMGDDDDEVLKWAYLNSYHQTGLRNLLDMAVLEHSEVHGLLEIEDKFKKVDEIPFDFQRRRMSVILEQHTGKHLLVCKGAIEEMLPLCTSAFDPGPDRQLHTERDAVVPMDENMRTRVTETCQRLNEDGMRVLLVAIREFGNRALTYSKEDESELILTGFIAFLDPPKTIFQRVLV
ncbi:MAG: magnesium-translocating P-type ATPase, partial [Bacteroidota bacterium]